MDFNIQTWKEFTIGRMFRLEPVKGKTTDELIAGSDIPYIAAKHDDNGLDMMCQKSGFEDWVSEGNCIVFVQLGEGSSGYVNYIPDDFIGMNGKVSCGYLDGVMNPYVGLFLEVILCQERPKHSFGRSWTGTRLTETVIKLPIQHNSDGTPVIDADKTYSDEGYIPDWQFMEDYIKSLHSEPITTTRGAAESLSLGVDKWEEFKIERLFSIKRGDRIVKDEDYFDIAPSDDYKYRVITASATNNGVDGVYNDFNCDGNCLISCGEANGMFTTWQNEPCWVLDTARIYTPKGFSINEITGMFLATLLSTNMYRFSYGRKAKPDNMYSLGLKLPIQRDTTGNPVIDPEKKYSDKGYIPDWDFMERYIDSLPYSDKIA